MNNKNTQYKLLNEFSEIAKQHKCWYAITGRTLLQTVKQKELPEQIEVMMTIESYKKLKLKESKRITDRFISANHPEVTPYFFSSKDKKGDHIRINIVVPTTIRAIKKFTSLSSKLNFYYSRIQLEDQINNTWDKINHFLSLPFKKFIKRKTHKTYFNEIFVEKNHGFFELSRPTNRQIKHWIPQLTFRTIPTNINDINVEIPYEYNTILANWFDDEYLNSEK